MTSVQFDQQWNASRFVGEPCLTVMQASRAIQRVTKRSQWVVNSIMAEYGFLRLADYELYGAPVVDNSPVPYRAVKGIIGRIAH